MRKKGKKLKIPYHASAAAIRDGNLPYITAICVIWRQLALYNNYLPLFLTITVGSLSPLLVILILICVRNPLNLYNFFIKYLTNNILTD